MGVLINYLLVKSHDLSNISILSSCGHNDRAIGAKIDLSLQTLYNTLLAQTGHIFEHDASTNGTHLCLFLSLLFFLTAATSTQLNLKYEFLQNNLKTSKLTKITQLSTNYFRFTNRALYLFLLKFAIFGVTCIPRH